MATATVYFSTEHNSAAIAYDRAAMRDLPVEAINHALSTLYKGSDLGPLLFEVWDGDRFFGLVVAEPFGAADDARIKLEFDHIVTRNKENPELGEWAPKEVPV